MELSVSKIIVYRSVRALQICMVYATTLLIERLLQFPKAGWIGFVVMMIYVGFDAGASMHRTLHRFWGTLIGLLLSYFLWILGILDYRLMLTLIPIAVFFSFFSLGKFYSYPTIFTVTLTTLGTAYFTPADYSVSEFFFDYFRATFIAFLICMFFEGIVFKNKKMTQVFGRNLERVILSELDQLLDILVGRPLKRAHFLKLSASCHAKIEEMRAFERTAKHDYAVQEQALSEMDAFHGMVSTILMALYQLFSLAPQSDAALILTIKERMKQLESFSSTQGTDRATLPT